MKKGIVCSIILICMLLSGCGNNKQQSKPQPVAPEVPATEKPVIYLYGYDNENVQVKLSLNGEFTCTYPKYNEEKGWEVVAKKDSTLVDSNKISYNYLYWEGNVNAEYDFSEGFCIRGSETASFLDKQLKSLGLNRKEINEFIVYWLPRMEKNNYNVISFQTRAYTDAAKLEVVPKPDKTFRVFMAWYPVMEFVEMKEQSFKVPTRSVNDKIVVEWGGSEVDSQTHKTAQTQIGASSNATDEELVAALASRTQEQIQALLVQAVYKKQEVALTNPAMLPGNPLGVQTTNPSGHAFTDKNGTSTTFTEEEWNKLKAIWAYTGHPEDFVNEHTVNELRDLLK